MILCLAGSAAFCVSSQCLSENGAEMESEAGSAAGTMTEPNVAAEDGTGPKTGYDTESEAECETGPAAEPETESADVRKLKA